ncbi:LysR family transcriptional regulator [Psittacicella hinzii]|uniref:HTH lysR-type domain-containing protein n=1 Tax=Psittacicella hinzii TaxID=2028575 RepID=A0A3A1YNB4_9GAMM|nr:LysR family transcriptional regulator [Psittacicella hinzii]RIY38719.1 hypothetical protein CKF58_03540 [Psittacicella hinzii]
MHNFNELNIFITVVQAGSFTKAAKTLNVTTSAISHAMSGLEAKLETKLLNRTTRSISCTEAGKNLYDRIQPLFAEINLQVEELESFANQAVGTIRINCADNVGQLYLAPRIYPYLKENPKVNLEFYHDANFVDIVKQRFDFGVRLGADLPQDMIGVQISPPLRMLYLAHKSYIHKHGTPQTPLDLVDHVCLGFTLNDRGTVVPWEFVEQGSIQNHSLNYQIRSNSSSLLYDALDKGMGILWLTAGAAQERLATGDYVEVLSTYAPTYDPLYLYYPQNRFKTKAMSEIIELLRYQQPLG